MPGSDWPLSLRKKPSKFPVSRDHRYDEVSDQLLRQPFGGRELDRVVVVDGRFEADRGARESWTTGVFGPGIGQQVVRRSGTRQAQSSRDDRVRLHVFEHPADVAVNITHADVEPTSDRVLVPTTHSL